MSVGLAPDKCIEVRRAAASALYGVLDIARAFFKEQQYKDKIIELVCIGCNSSDYITQKNSLLSFIKISELYYEYLSRGNIESIWQVCSKIYIIIIL